MKVYIKTKRNKGFVIPVPSMLASLVLSPRLADFAKRQAMTHGDKESVAYIQDMDFKELFSSVRSLLDYKGLKLVEVSDRQGNEVTIIL